MSRKVTSKCLSDIMICQEYGTFNYTTHVQHLQEDFAHGEKFVDHDGFSRKKKQ